MERSRPSLSRPSPASVADTSRFGACGADCPLEKAIRTDASANIGAAQSSREATMLVRDFASEQPESVVESQAPGGVAQATSLVVPSLERPSAPSQERDMSSSVNVYDKSLLLDNPECKLLDLVLNKLQD